MSTVEVLDATEVLPGYREALENADLSRHTRRAYASRVAGFLSWLQVLERPAALSDPNERDYAVRDYVSWLKAVQKVAPATVNGHRTALDHLYEYYLRIGRPAAPRVHVPRSAPEGLDEAEQMRLIRATDLIPVRDKAIVLLLLYTGLRVEEAVAVDVDDVVMSARRGKVIVREGKGRKYREVPLHRAARKALQAWLGERAKKSAAGETGALFLTRGGGRMAERSLWYIVDRVGTAAAILHDSGRRRGKSRVHPHALRHTFVTNLVRKGVDLVIVADLVGHASVETTRGYAGSTESDRERVVEEHLVADE